MENIFWLMWVADIVGSINFLCSVIVLCTGIGLAIFTISSFVDDENKKARLCLKWFAIVFFVFSFIGVLTPTKNTVHALIAVNVGKEAIETKIGEKAAKALDAVLDRVISGEAPEKKK